MSVTLLSFGPPCAPSVEGRGEVATSFTVDGQPIHPGLVALFLPWLSDRESVVQAVDVSAARGARNQYPPRTVRAGPDQSFAYTSADETFAYRVLGRLADGAFTVLTWSSGRGSGVFYDVLLIDVVRNGGRWIMTCPRAEPLGDRVSASTRMKIEGDRVVIEGSNLGGAIHVVVRRP